MDSFISSNKRAGNRITLHCRLFSLHLCIKFSITINQPKSWYKRNVIISNSHGSIYIRKETELKCTAIKGWGDCKPWNYSWLAFHCCDKTLTRTNMVRKGLLLITACGSSSSREAKQKSTEELETETQELHWYCLAPWPKSSCFSCTTQALLPRDDSTIQSQPGPPTQENVP